MTIDDVETALLIIMAACALMTLVTVSALVYVALTMRRELRDRFKRPQVARNGDGRRLYERR